MSIFTKFKAPKARPSMLQSLTDFAWGTRGQSGPFAINKIAPQNVKVAMMMNNAKIPCGKCKTVRWVAGYKLNILSNLLFRPLIRCELISREAYRRRKHADEVEFRNGYGGMQMRDFKIGPGVMVCEGDQVTVHYTSKSLHNRLVEDSEVNFPHGISFFAGSSVVPPVLSQGVIGMKVGGKREIIAPPQMHFPNDLKGQILIYEINLVNHKRADA